MLWHRETDAFEIGLKIAGFLSIREVRSDVVEKIHWPKSQRTCHSVCSSLSSLLNGVSAKCFPRFRFSFFGKHT